MQMLARMNAKMDQGYKLTNFYCTFCNGVTMAKPMGSGENAEGMVYCPKCQKEYVPVREDGDEEGDQGEEDEGIVEIGEKKEINQAATKSAQKFQPLNADPEPEDPTEQQYNEFLALYNSPKKTAQQLKSQEISKKMGAKLISGWAMLEEACQDCNVPLMRSKKGNMVCCGCEKDYMKSKEEKGKKEERKEEKKEVKETAQPQKQQKPKQQPQPQPQHEPQTQPQPLRHIKLHPHSPSPSSNPEPSLHHKHHSHTNMQHNTQLCQKIERISYGTLDFLQGRMQRAFEMNDLQAVERVLRLVKMVKELM